MKGIAVLGATGSIGRQSLDVLAQHPDRFRLTSLSAGRDVAGLAALALHWRPPLVVIADPALESDLRGRLASGAPQIRVASGAQALLEAASESAAEVVIAAIVGAAGLPSTLAAARHGKTLLLANKEALVVAGPLILAAASASGARLLPLDSEHNALFQCLPDGRPDAGVDRLWLTASGGPFLGWTSEAMAKATPEQAVAHPNWKMGAKISVDSATLMNKGLEVIEAERLFALGADRIGVLIHPQSVLHAMVEYIDGSFIAHLGAPDMRIPIAHALGWPERLRNGAPRLDLAAMPGLSFQSPDLERFPCLRLAFEALRSGPVAPIVLNAANEVAVAAFLARKLPFTSISAVVEAALSQLPVSSASTLDEVLALDQLGRQLARSAIAGGNAISSSGDSG